MNQLENSVSIKTALRQSSAALDIFSFIADLLFWQSAMNENISGEIMSEEPTLYSVVLSEDQAPQIVEGQVEEAVFIGTQEECQAEILMLLLAD